MNSSEAKSLVLRYGALLALGFVNYLLGENGLFYAIFTPVTINSVYFILHLLYNATFFEPNIIFFKGYYATIISACVAGSAYYLLLILNLSTPMNGMKRLASLTMLFVSFLIINILRIVLFASLLFKGYKYFDLAHLATWYFGSTILVVILWFFVVLSFDIKGAPIISDIKLLWAEIKGRPN